MDGRIKLRHLQCFLAVMQHRSLQKAADAMSITQPAVSKTIAEMEEIMGARLFERGRNGAKPTDKAELFWRYAGATVSTLRQGMELLSGGDRADGGTIRLGVLPTVAPSLIPQALQLFQQQWKNVVVRITSGLNMQLMQQLKAQELDLVIGRLSEPDSMVGLTFEHLFADQLSVAVRAGHPLLSLPTLSVEHIMAYSLLLPPLSTVIRNAADSFLTAHGVGNPAAYIEVLSVSLGRELVLRNDAVWFVPTSAVRLDLENGVLRSLPFPMAGSEQMVGLALSNAVLPSPVTEAMIHAIREVAARQHPG
ncbi:pca operon transcription factor PcaQ [Undibacterium terreum]|uniref:Pca operon transcription factor PcaQ n=1 Tax=Undibacterium terreum TaxID=1224302 RepID=A0A916UU52_9BURK|nr:pca operon transcription factor PcaQ [Undibacterium terreum]GGC86994.1 pca operon transcription factor PcaQ [Undibacterium terreum]